MRLDYTLYGLAIIFFIVTVVSFAAVSEQDGKSLWAVSTVVLGLLSVSAGYVLKPKNHTSTIAASTIAPTEAATEMPQQTTSTVETPIIDAPPVETMVPAEAPPVDFSPAVETPVIEALKIEKMISSDVPSEVPVATSPAVTPIVETSAPPADTPIVEPLSLAASIDLTQIKGIGEKRASQLKTLGINSIDDLAKSNIADLAAKLKTSAKIVEKWVTGAKELIK